MARVIKRIRSTIDCGCGATIEYGPSDVHTGGGQSDYEIEPEYKYIRCPDCKQVVHLCAASRDDRFDDPTY